MFVDEIGRKRCTGSEHEHGFILPHIGILLENKGMAD